MKIIKKLCIPLFSLVLVLGCFAASQMNASAYTSDYACPGHRVYMYLAGCSIVKDPEFIGGAYHYSHMHIWRCPVAGCGMQYTPTESLTSSLPCVGGNVSGGDTGGGGGSHTHNYSTTWGGWRKISSCRLPD